MVNRVSSYFPKEHHSGRLSSFSENVHKQPKPTGSNISFIDVNITSVLFGGIQYLNITFQLPCKVLYYACRKSNVYHNGMSVQSNNSL